MTLNFNKKGDELLIASLLIATIKQSDKEIPTKVEAVRRAIKHYMKAHCPECGDLLQAVNCQCKAERF